MWRAAQGLQILVVFGFAEDADACDDAALMAARGQSFDQEAIGFVAAAVGRVVERVLGEEDAHLAHRTDGFNAETQRAQR